MKSSSTAGNRRIVDEFEQLLSEAKVKSELSQLQSALYDREPGPRGLRTLQKRALDVDSLIEEYQRLLGKTHSEIAKEAQEMGAEITVALMAAEADA